AAAPAAKPAASGKLPPGATPVVQPGGATLDANSFGSDQDYQFVRAVDLLRGVTLFKSMAAQ
ncbi:MAG: S41 family peptidase, partial [Stellaceae bacterium]